MTDTKTKCGPEKSVSAKASSTETAKIKTRFATSDSDIDLLLPLSIEFHKESRFSHIPFSVEKRNRIMADVIAHPKTKVWIIAELGDELIGYIHLQLGEYVVGTDVLIASMNAFYVRKKYRGSLLGGKVAVRLLANAIKWSEVRGASELNVHVSSGVDLKRTDRFLRRTKFKTVGGNYSLSLQNGAGI